MQSQNPRVRESKIVERWLIQISHVAPNQNHLFPYEMPHPARLSIVGLMNASCITGLAFSASPVDSADRLSLVLKVIAR